MTTIKDIAKLAKVGTTTVSRVINNSDKVTPTTKKRVEQAMQELNYQPNQYARTLKSNKSNTIAVSVPSIWHPFYSEFIFHIEKKVAEKGYRLLISSNDSDDQVEIEFLEMVRQNKVDGIIALTYHNIDRYLSSNIPFVSIDRYFKEKVAYVTSDNYHGGEIAAEELIKRGCKKLAYVAAVAPQKNDTLKRKDGFIDKARELGYEVAVFLKPEPIENYPDFFEHFFEIYPATDGILAMNDSNALLLLDYLQSKNIRVPEDIQIIGYDGFRYFENFETSLTSIKQPIQQMAEAAFDLLFRLIAGEEIGTPIVLPVQFKEGKTTKKIPLTD
ncbi:MAG: LacI family DNA-binding transcriptional regulator [Enterococcus avium]